MLTSNAHQPGVLPPVGSLWRHLKTSLILVMSICFAVTSNGDTYVPILAKISPTGGSRTAYVNQSLIFKVESSDSCGRPRSLDLRPGASCAERGRRSQ